MPTPYTMKFIIMVWLAFFARPKPGLDDGEAGLHEHDEEAGDERPDEVDRDLVLADEADHVADREADLRVADGDVADRAGERAGRVAQGAVLGLGRRHALDISVRDRTGAAAAAAARRGGGAALPGAWACATPASARHQINEKASNTFFMIRILSMS